MKRTILLGLIILFTSGMGAGFSQEISASLRNNRYYLESLRLSSLAQEHFDLGDYDGSANYAAEALRYTQLSDEYVALQLKIKETDDAIAAAKTRFNWAASIGAAQTYPQEYGTAEQAYGEAVSFRSGESWDDAIAAAQRVIDALASITPPAGKSVFPAQYKVRPWSIAKDCLWNIAGRPWAYGDPEQWRLLYNANKDRLPNPDNPNLVDPGTVLDIPSLQGEYREGLWNAHTDYDAIR
jgi:hypothetical protein